MTTPFLAAAVRAATTTTGVERTRAQGQAVTRTCKERYTQFCKHEICQRSRTKMWRSTWQLHKPCNAQQEQYEIKHYGHEVAKTWLLVST